MIDFTGAKSESSSDKKSADKISKALDRETDDEGKKKKLSERQKARRMLLQALYQWEMARAPVNEILAEFLVYYQGKIDRDFFKEVFPQVVAHAPALDQQMAPWLDRELTALDPIELSLLRLGMYELAHRIDIPFKVVINEAVELAKVFGATDSHKYINGVLDRASKDLRALEQRGTGRI
ncbi:MAG: transcription antitermination factor NusB [Pseudohongiella sp.]|nr:transcription antitermination factor NusB [Pseudohongiella sp.]MDO9521354.1 transcription antitermination factor NusB [Pseudohongiella sp.]MDP2125878.1 transcription antitermination factor NusB [Pseudohongiella sp.]